MNCEEVQQRKTDPSFVEEVAPFGNTYMSRREHKSWSQISTRPEAKSDCAGEASSNFPD
jgi:hypothetical protein